MRVPKNVSLCARTNKIADEMDNFSRFVRIALIAWENGHDFEEVRALWRSRTRVLRRLEHLLADRIGAEQAWEMIQEAEKWAREQVELEVE